MRSSNRKVYAAIAVGALLLGVGPAQAALVNFSFSGDVEYSTGYGGLTADDWVIVTGTFNDDALVGGTGTIQFGGATGNSLSIQAGTYSFTEANDALTSASISLVAGDLAAFDYAAITGVNGAVANFDSFFLSFGAGGELVGTWQTTVAITPVPVPAAVWLMSSGLLGLAGFARRRGNRV